MARRAEPEAGTPVRWVRAFDSNVAGVPAGVYVNAPDLLAWLDRWQPTGDEVRAELERILEAGLKE